MKWPSLKETNWVPAAIALGAGLIFLPFGARFFLGDDWLWLASGIQAIDDPALLLSRPIYGYFRPLALLMFSVGIKLVGAKAVFFGTMNVVLHAVNVWLLMRVLTELGAARRLACLAGFLFGFYYLNAPAIAWIATAPDLWVTMFTLLFVLVAHRQAQSPNWRLLLIMLGLGLMATLTKESGFATLGLYFVVLITTAHRSASRSHVKYSIILTAVYMAYLLYYFQTRTVVDKELSLGLDLVINLWYFSGYLLLPLSKRIATAVPQELTWLLITGKAVVTITIPFMFWVAWRKGGHSLRIFLAWMLGFLLTVSMFRWDVSLWSLFPERTASRYMYSPSLGMMVLVAWFLLAAWERWFDSRRFARWMLCGFGVLYIVANSFIIERVTQTYRSGQERERQIYAAVVAATTKASPEQVTVFVSNEKEAPPSLTGPDFLQGMILVGTGREVAVHIERRAISSRDSLAAPSHLVVRWDHDQDQLQIVSPQMQNH